MQKPKPPLSAWLIRQRKERGWKPADVAMRLDVAEVTVRGWESGRSMRADTVGELEKLFGVKAPGSEVAATSASDLGAVLEALRLQVELNGQLMARVEQGQAEREAMTDELARLRADVDAALQRLGIASSTVGQP